MLSVHESGTYLIKGDYAQVRNTAGTGLSEIAAKLQDDPTNEHLWVMSSQYRAILGEREAALADHKKAYTIALATKNSLWAMAIHGLLLFVHAFLGDREQALQELSKRLKTPFGRAHWLRVDWRLSLLWDDLEFQAIVNDPDHNAPLPFDLMDSQIVREMQLPLTPL